MAMGQYINHPPQGSQPNVMVASTDMQLQPGVPLCALVAPVSKDQQHPWWSKALALSCTPCRFLPAMVASVPCS